MSIQGLALEGGYDPELFELLHKLLDQCKSAKVLSKSVEPRNKEIKVAILLPIASNSPSSSTECLSRLHAFAESLARTTWRDTHQLVGQRFAIRVYLAIDHSDDPLLAGHDNKTDLNIAEAVLVSQNICDVKVQVCGQRVGHVYAIWRQTAKKAWEDGCDYFVLMGDNVVLKDEGWVRDMHAEFTRIAQRNGTPHGFGCVAFTDVNSPGMPTFPVFHRTHLDIFGGEVIPQTFVDDDGVSFLYQLYRRWDCSRMFGAKILSGTGTNQPAHCKKQHCNLWTFGPLDGATATCEDWLSRHCPTVARKVTLDIVIPSFRVQVPYLERMLNLQPSSTCTTMFIVVIDDPRSPARAELEAKFATRPDVRILVNEKNLGASASRNRGMEESAAEWIIFLDDDITPKPDLLVEAEKAVRAHPDAVGFIGVSQLPPAESIFTASLYLEGVVDFWDIAKRVPDDTDLPWGVTANLMARRIDDGVKFDLRFPKTGGGEDIDFCRRKRDSWFPAKQKGFHSAPGVVVSHPWWNGGKRSYRRFYVWSKGDAALIHSHPDLFYLDHAPNGGELLFISCVLGFFGMSLLLLIGILFPLVLALHLAFATVTGNMVHDVYRHLFRDVQRTRTLNLTPTGLRLFVAVVESSLIRLACESGRVVFHLERGNVQCLGHRFEWFTNNKGDGPKNDERRNSRERAAIAVVILALTLRAAYQG